MGFIEYRPTRTLFKYSSAEGFLGIVRSKRLWFTDLASANDPREIKLGYEHFAESLKSVLGKEYNGEKGQALAQLGERLAAFRLNAQAFSCCFAQIGDELPMWREYGSDYSGVAVGFRPAAVIDIPARVQLVKYVDENTTDDFRRLVIDVAIELERVERADAVYMKDIEYWMNASVDTWSAIMTLKHQSWAHEREVRLVYMQPRAKPAETEAPLFKIASFLPNDEPVMWREPLVRSIGDTKIGYLDFPFGRFRSGKFEPSGAIEKVILGPRCSLTVEAVEAVMREKGYDHFEVSQSACQIR